MSVVTIIIIVLILLLIGGGGYGYRSGAYSGNVFGGGLGLVIAVLLVLYLLGVFH